MSGHAQRTERATPRKHEKLCAEGQIIRSEDVVAASVLALGALATRAMLEPLTLGAPSFARHAFRVSRGPSWVLRALLAALAPLALRLSAAALAAAVARRRRPLTRSPNGREPTAMALMRARRAARGYRVFSSLAVLALREVDPKATVRTLGVVSA